jgi:hypothetical protein
MLNLLSRIKSKLWRVLDRRVYIEKLHELLIYPHDNAEVSFYLDSLPLEKRNIISGNLLSLSITTYELKARYSYLNSRNNFTAALECYKEIVRRESHKRGVFRKAGLRKLYMSRFLFSDLNDSYKINLLKSYLKLSHNFEGYDSKFGDVISGKNVAIVGGAPSEVKNGIEIDEFDLVARINVNSTQTLGADKLGNRCDIVYIRGERGELIINRPSNYFSLDPSGLSVYRVKLKKHLEAFPKNINASLVTNFDEVFDYGHLNAVQSAVLDLLVHGASSIKIYNVDFNLSGASFSGYRPNNLASVQYEKIFASHPPHPQFKLFKQLHMLGVLSGDDKFESIISLSLEEFILKCDERWAIETS